MNMQFFNREHASKIPHSEIEQLLMTHEELEKFTHKQIMYGIALLDKKRGGNSSYGN